MEDGPGVEPSFAYCRKFSTDTGARSLNSSTVMSPSEVEMTHVGLPGAGVAGWGAGAAQPSEKGARNARAVNGVITIRSYQRGFALAGA